LLAKALTAGGCLVPRDAKVTESSSQLSGALCGFRSTFLYTPTYPCELRRESIELSAKRLIGELLNDKFAAALIGPFTRGSALGDL
jgi:hypothetical protein